MRKIDPYQLKKIYAMAHGMGISSGSREDELHILVYGLTGKESIKGLTYREAADVIDRLEGISQEAQAPPKNRMKTHSQRPGGITAGQQKKIWALMYELESYDEKPAGASLGERLCAIIKKELGTDALPKNPFAWIDFKAGNHLIEVLKGYLRNEEKKRGVV